MADINFGLDNYGVIVYYKLNSDYERAILINKKKRRKLLEKAGIEDPKKDKAEEGEGEGEEGPEMPKSIKKLDKLIVKFETKQAKNRVKLEKYRDKHEEKAVMAFVTMKSMEGYERIQKAYKVSLLNRCCCCCKRKKFNSRYLDGKWLKFKEASESSIILWENLAVKKKERCARQTIIAVISFVLMLVSFAFIIASKQVSKVSQSKYKNQTCPKAEITPLAAQTDYLKSQQN